LVTTNSVFANGISVTIVEIVSRALVCIQTLTSTIASIEAIRTGADLTFSTHIELSSLVAQSASDVHASLFLFLLVVLLYATLSGLVVANVQVVMPSPWRLSLHVQTKPSSVVGVDVQVALTWHTDGDSRHLSVGTHLMGRHSTGTESIISI
jgi:hypothetical protein